MNNIKLTAPCFDLFKSVLFYTRISTVSALIAFALTFSNSDSDTASNFILIIMSIVTLCFVERYRISKPIDKYFNYLAPLNYIIGIACFIFWVSYTFIYNNPEQKFVLWSLAFFPVTVINLCIICTLLSFRSANAREISQMLKFCKERKPLYIHLRFIKNFQYILSFGFITVDICYFIANNKKYDLFDVQKYFKDNNIDFNELTIEDLDLMEMMLY